jgi:hypothetical protein
MKKLMFFLLATVAVSCEKPAPTIIIYAITGIELQKPSKEINVGDTYQMVVKTLPEVAGLTYEWGSSDNNVATISQSGLLVAKAVGQVEITAKYGAYDSSVIINIWKSSGHVDPGEQQNKIALLTSNYWIIFESNVSGYYDEGVELSMVYWYKTNGELWSGRKMDFPSSAAKVAVWTLAGNKITETWLWSSKSYMAELTSVSAERLTFTDYIKNGVAYYRTYAPFTPE